MNYFKEEGFTGFFLIETKESVHDNKGNITVDIAVSDDWLPPRVVHDKSDNTWKGTVDYSLEGCPVPISYVPATRVSLTARRDIFDNAFPIDWGKNWGEIFDPDDPLTDLFDTDRGLLFGDYVELAMIRLRSGKFLNRIQLNQFRKVIDIAYLCSKFICTEVIHDSDPHLFIEPEEDYEDFGPFAPYGLVIGTSDDPLGEPLYAGALSSGTQGTLLWIYALALKMAYHHDWQEGWEKKPAILLIDEIENHLHPTWQRRVIPALLEHFPGLQIFATTHSPFVVAGLKAGQVHLLRRNEDGVVTATTNTEDVVGWTADEILRTMMGVEDPTDAQTAEAARELRQLRNEPPRTDPGEEKQRQKRMQDLRQLVDRDLLAGGPMAAQRELFEEQFAEALKKHQQARDLNQENR